jgi:hypothetical protein
MEVQNTSGLCVVEDRMVMGQKGRTGLTSPVSEKSKLRNIALSLEIEKQSQHQQEE